jgi:peptidoglycan L-alanyl-D-glutamate endopeptidase CwlK
MPAFSTKSLARLETCHPSLQRVAKMAIVRYDFVVLCGHRSKAEQEDAYERGMSKLRWPASKHNQAPSLAMDLAPYPIDWRDVKAFHDLARIILEEAAKIDVKLRWGGDWNGNGRQDEKFIDMPHFELVERKT